MTDFQFVATRIGQTTRGESCLTARLNFVPIAAALEPFRRELDMHKTTKGVRQIPTASPCQMTWLAERLSIAFR